MTTERKLFYASGAIIMAGMIAIVSFSLGVYIGEQGWTWQPPSVAGPGSEGRPAGEPQQPQVAGGQTPRADLIGAVRRVSADSLELGTPEGLRTVLVDGETRLVRRVGGQEEPVRWSDLQRGTRVAVFGEFGGDGRALTAQLVVVVSPPK
jgi:hypothetical protein